LWTRARGFRPGLRDNRSVLRENQPEILDGASVPDTVVRQSYIELARIHRWLGDTGVIVRLIRRDPLPVRRILDIGCATGAVLEDVRRRLRVEAIGVDLAPRAAIAASLPIVKADAVRDPLPEADVAYSMHVGHHLAEADLARMIRNVGRYCRRFLLLDLVRNPVPLFLFRTFVAPIMSYVVGEDGKRSLRRAYTPPELRRITSAAVQGTGSTFRHTVAPFYIRQVVDVTYGAKSQLDDIDLSHAGAVAGERGFGLLERP
jgi:SAM-dependent methyltransferase